MKAIVRTILGVGVAPLFPGTALALLALLNGDATTARQYFIDVALLGYPFMLVVGLPTIVVLFRFHLFGWQHYATVGALLGMLSCLALFLIGVGTGSTLSAAISVIAFAPIVAFFSSVTSLCFWLVARPDLST